MNSIARGKSGFIVRMARAAGRLGNCFTMPASEKSRMSQVESMRGAKILTPRRRGIENVATAHDRRTFSPILKGLESYSPGLETLGAGVPRVATSSQPWAE